MGNWRTVQIVGTCPEKEVGLLRVAADPGKDYSNLGPLSCGSGICGLGNWPATAICSVGNLAERGYGPQDVAEHLETLAESAPGLRVVVHCGGDWEDRTCVATVVLHNGSAQVVEPQIEEIPAISEAQMLGNIILAIQGQPR